MVRTKVFSKSRGRKTTTGGHQPVARQMRGLERADEGRTEKERGGGEKKDDERGKKEGQTSC